MKDPGEAGTSRGVANLDERSTMSDRTCSVTGCPYPHHALGYCSGHYQRVVRHGDPQVHLPLLRPRGAYDWRANIVRLDGDEGCWHWRTPSRRGYAYLTIDGVQMLAHRFVYEQIVGPVPDGSVLDHVCHNRATDCSDDLDCPHRKCVNPAHLEPVTHGENVRRGHGMAGKNAQKTHCYKGHPFSGDNLKIIMTKGRPARVCLTCRRENGLRSYYRRKTRTD